MGSVQHSILIDASSQTIWDAINDVTDWSDWVTFIDQVTYINDEDFAEGVTYRETGGPMNRESDWEITDFHASRRQIHHGDRGIIEAVLTVELDPVEDATRVYQTIDYRVLPQFRPLGILIEALFIDGIMDRGTAKTLRNLKYHVEGTRLGTKQVTA